MHPSGERLTMCVRGNETSDERRTAFVDGWTHLFFLGRQKVTAGRPLAEYRLATAAITRSCDAADTASPLSKSRNGEDKFSGASAWGTAHNSIRAKTAWFEDA